MATSRIAAPPIGPWSENRTLAGRAAVAGGAERRRLIRCGGLAGVGDWQDVGGEAGFDGFEDDPVASPFDGAGGAAALVAGVWARPGAGGAQVGVLGVGVRQKVVRGADL